MELNMGLFKEKINRRVNIMDLEIILQEYGKTIIPLPEETFNSANVYDIEKENRTNVYIPLWTGEEGRRI